MAAIDDGGPMSEPKAAEPTPGHGDTPSVLRGGSVLLTGRLVVAVLGWTGTVVIVRQLSPTGWGGYSLVFSLLGLVGTLADLRVSRMVLGAILDAGDDAGPVVGSYLAMRALLGLVAYAIAMAVVLLGGYPDDVVRGTAVAGLVLVLAAANSSLDVVLSARFWWRTQSLAGVVGQAVQMALIVAIAAGRWGTIVRFAAPAVVGELIALWWKLRFVRRAMTVRLRVDLPQWKAWSRESAAVAVGGAIATVYFRVDMVLLSQLDTLRSVGLYGVGYKFSDLAGFVAVAVCTPVLTLMVKAWPDDRAAFARAFHQAFLILGTAAVGLTVGFAAFASPVVETLYGRRYLAAAGAARGLMLGQAVNYFTTLCLFALLAVGRNRRYVVAAAVGLVVNVGLNLVLIPVASYDGAAIATVATEVLVLAALGAATLRLPGIRPLPWRPAGAVVLAGAAMAAVSAALAGRVPWPAAAVAAAAVYVAGLAALGVVAELRSGPSAAA